MKLPQKSFGFILAVVLALCARNFAQVSITVDAEHTVRLSHPSMIDQQYYIERSFDLVSWQRQGLITPGTGAPLQWSDHPDGAPKAFYRMTPGPLIPHRLYGLDFSPYLDGQDPNLRVPISQTQIEARMRPLIPYTDWIRTFSMVDGLQVSGRVAHQLGFKAALGAWLGPEGTQAGLQANQENINNLIAAGQAGEADLLIVGSEVLQRNDLAPATLRAYMDQVKAAVPGIPVTTADTYGRLIDSRNSAVLAACDPVMVNFYPFWESKPITDSMKYVHQYYTNLRMLAGGREVWGSETGWPSDGNPLGAAVPSPENAADYFQRFTSWARAGGVPFFYFEATDESWKTNEGSVGGHWGVWDSAYNIKPGMQPVFDNLDSPADWNAVINGAGTPAIAFTSMPPIGDGSVVSGTVSHVAPFDVFISLYIRAGGNWWEKPFANEPFTAVSRDGTWSITFATGGSDASATEIAAYLFPKNYTPPHVLNASSLPAELSTQALTHVTVIRQ